MSSKGPNNGTSFVNGTNIGTISWLTPNNAQISDDLYATATLTLGTTSNYLRVTGFGFSIPTGAKILGIKAEIEKSYIGVNAPTDNSVKIIKSNNIPGGSERGKSGAWTTTDTYYTYGGPTDLWGTSWNSSNINNSGFGVAISATNTSAGTAQVDHVRMTVYYSGGAPPPPSPSPPIAISSGILIALSSKILIISQGGGGIVLGRPNFDL